MATPPPADPRGALNGILWMLVTTSGFTGANVGSQYLARTYDPIEATWGRSSSGRCSRFRFCPASLVVGSGLCLFRAERRDRARSAREAASSRSS